MSFKESSAMSSRMRSSEGSRRQQLLSSRESSASDSGARMQTNRDSIRDDRRSTSGSAQREISRSKSNGNSTSKTKFPKMTAEEFKQYVKGMIRIPEDKWMSIPENSQICYAKKDGTYVKSGYVRLTYSKNGGDFLRYGTKMYQAPNDKYYKEFTINLSKIARIYKMVSRDAAWEFKIMGQRITDEIATRDDHIAVLNERVDKVEDSLRRIVKFVKRLHNINSLDDLK